LHGEWRLQWIAKDLKVVKLDFGVEEPLWTVRFRDRLLFKQSNSQKNMGIAKPLIGK
jgi:hypothetical protein